MVGFFVLKNMQLEKPEANSNICTTTTIMIFNWADAY